MKELSFVLLKMEYVYMIGQHRIGKEGWETFASIVEEEIKKESIIRLKKLDIQRCQIDSATIELLEETLRQLDHTFKLSTDKKICACCC